MTNAQEHVWKAKPWYGTLYCSTVYGINKCMCVGRRRGEEGEGLACFMTQAIRGESSMWYEGANILHSTAVKDMPWELEVLFYIFFI